MGCCPQKKSTYSIQQNFDLIQFIPPDLSKWQSPIFLTLKQTFCQQTFSAKLHAIAGAVKALFSINGSQIWTTMLLIVFSLNHVKTLALFQVKNHLPKLHWALKAQTHQYLPISTTISTTCFRRLKTCHSLQLKLQLTQNTGQVPRLRIFLIFLRFHKPATNQQTIPEVLQNITNVCDSMPA